MHCYSKQRDLFFVMSSKSHVIHTNIMQFNRKKHNYKIVCRLVLDKDAQLGYISNG